ncbi:MAG: hypothetical protein WCA12_00825 [Burkholderiales bacterium]
MTLPLQPGAPSHGFLHQATTRFSFDALVLAHSHIVSGHTLKHVAAAAAGFVACYVLTHRTLESPAPTVR